jgi:hypothetical protein
MISYKNVCSINDLMKDILVQQQFNFILILILRGSPLPHIGIVFRYSWVDVAEIFRDYMCCVNLISCKFLIHKIFVLTSYGQSRPQNGGLRKVPISRTAEEVESECLF